MSTLKILTRCLQKQKLRCSSALGEAIRLKRMLQHRHSQLQYLQQLSASEKVAGQDIDQLIKREKQLIEEYRKAFHHKVEILSCEKEKLQDMEKQLEVIMSRKVKSRISSRIPG